MEQKFLFCGLSFFAAEEKQYKSRNIIDITDVKCYNVRVKIKKGAIYDSLCPVAERYVSII